MPNHLALTGSKLQEIFSMPNHLAKNKKILRTLAGFFISTNIYDTMVSRKL